MRDIITVLILLAFLLTSAQAADFRRTNWGMSPEEVIASEGSPPGFTDEDTVMYEDEIGHFTCNVFFKFLSGKLASAGYVILDSHSSDLAYIDDFDAIDEMLREKYGAPIRSDRHWKEDFLKDMPDQWGFAVSAGFLTYDDLWETEYTNIGHLLSGDNYEINHFIFYSSKELAHLGQSSRAQKKKQEIEEKF